MLAVAIVRIGVGISGVGVFQIVFRDMNDIKTEQQNHEHQNQQHRAEHVGCRLPEIQLIIMLALLFLSVHFPASPLITDSKSCTDMGFDR